jgi:DNA primase
VPSGQEDYLFNVVATDSTADTIHLTEGELDALVLAEVLGEPVVGIPGAAKWARHWVFHFQSFRRVLLWPDGDKAGRDMANRVRKELPQIDVVQMPSGHDVNSVYSELGPETLRGLAGVDESTLLEVAHV